MDILGIGKAIVDIAGRFIPDPKDKLNFQLEVMRLAEREQHRAHTEMMGQISVNREEAKSSSMFVAGWRPYIGWTGGVGLSYSFVVEPIMSWVARVAFKYTGDFPALDTSSLMVLVTGMLGFGGLRALEKIKGVPDSEPLGTPAPKPKKKVLGIVWPF